MPSSVPSISISPRLRHSSPRPSYTALPMAIPRASEPVPPPLPPPHFIPGLTAGHDPGWQWGNDPDCPDFGRPAVPVKPGSSLLGGGHPSHRPSTTAAAAASPSDTHTHTQSHTHAHTLSSSCCSSVTFSSSVAAARRGSSISTVTASHDVDMCDDAAQSHSDDDTTTATGSSSRPPRNYGLQGERQLEQRTLQDSSKDYDKQLLSRIGGPNTHKRSSTSSYPTGIQETAQLAHAESEWRGSTGQLWPLSLTDRRHPSLDSTSGARWPTAAPSSGAMSPRSAGVWDHARPDGSRVRARHGSHDEHQSHRSSYRQAAAVSADEFVMDEGNMNNLRIHDRSPSGSEDLHARAGTKRRASSPPRDSRATDDRPSAGGDAETLARRSAQQHLAGRDSPSSRFHPNHSSISSASSYGAPRHGSLGSSLGVSSVPSSATSYGSGRHSPNSVLSSAYDSDLQNPAAVQFTKSASAAVSPPLSQHHRVPSASSQGSVRKTSGDDGGAARHSRHPSFPHKSGVHMCECCPKKPKKFETKEDLRLHESEKQYTCAYCPNRFKNKNEAERHQNSLHLRRHSWSCAALPGIEAAFHASPSGSSNNDACGYCGREFANPADWEARARHLNHVHKFGECNQTKKFYRADHFRQHLKHSHAGTSGKWTNMLETACMQDEPPPEKRVVGGNAAASASASAPSTASHTAGHSAQPALVISTAGLSSMPNNPGPPTIPETPHDS